MTRILIADDHPIVMSGVEAILRGSEFDIVARARNGHEVLSAIIASEPQILLIDVAMPGLSGIDVLRTLRAKRDSRKIVLLTASLGARSLTEAVNLDVDGILLKEGAEHLLLRCLRDVARGRKFIDRDLLTRAQSYAKDQAEHDNPAVTTLTNRERAIAGLVARGLRNRQIAQQLGLTEGTVKVYLHRIYEKLGIANRTELAILARDLPDR